MADDIDEGDLNSCECPLRLNVCRCWLYGYDEDEIEDLDCQHNNLIGSPPLDIWFDTVQGRYGLD